MSRLERDLPPRHPRLPEPVGHLGGELEEEPLDLLRDYYKIIRMIEQLLLVRKDGAERRGYME